MIRKVKLLSLIVFLAALVAASVIFIRSSDFVVLSPSGSVSEQQRDLFVKATLLMLIVVVPVYILTFLIAWRYREGNKKANYSPDWSSNRFIETTWWAIPGIIILALGWIIWHSSHSLDPFRPLASSKKPLKVQVVALQWRWLFIYPEQNIASVNYLQIPKDTPINFEITADAPMNSFWIPKLGGQVYAMPGMTTKLHLIADEAGRYQGSSANISGAGFAGMNFIVKSGSQAEFDQWVRQTREGSETLSMSEYQKLAQPTRDKNSKYYSAAEEDLHHKIVMKYMTPQEREADVAGSHSH